MKKKLKLLLTFVVITKVFVVVLVAKESSTATAVSELINKTTQQLEVEYVPEVIIEAKWGKGQGEFGFTTIEGDIFPIQTKIVVDNDENIYVLDKVNNRIQMFNNEGKYICEIPVESFQQSWFYDKNSLPIVGSLDCYNTDLCIDSNDNLYFLTPIKNGKRYIEIYSTKNGLSFRRRLNIYKEKIKSILIDELDALYINEILGNREKTYKVAFSSYSEECEFEEFIGIGRSKNGLIFLKPEIVEDKKWVIPLLNNKKRMNLIIESDKKLFSVKFLRSDSIGNIYFLVTQSDGMYIYKYSKLKFLTKIKGYEGTKDTFFTSSMVIDNNGNIYQLAVEYPTVKVIKWRKK